jgi:hypothetical protein
MVATVSAADLYKPVGRTHVVAIGSGRHVAVKERFGQRRISSSELRGQFLGKTTDISFDLSTGVVRHQTHNLFIETDAAQVARPI